MFRRTRFFKFLLDLLQSCKSTIAVWKWWIQGSQELFYLCIDSLFYFKKFEFLTEIIIHFENSKCVVFSYVHYEFCKRKFKMAEKENRKFNFYVQVWLWVISGMQVVDGLLIFQIQNGGRKKVKNFPLRIVSLIPSHLKNALHAKYILIFQNVESKMTKF